MNGTSQRLTSEQYLRPDDASAYLKSFGFPVARATLAKLRSLGDGPKYYRFGRLVIYTRGDLREWALHRVQSSIFASTIK